MPHDYKSSSKYTEHDSISRKIMIGLGILKYIDIFGVKFELMHKK